MDWFLYDSGPRHKRVEFEVLNRTNKLRKQFRPFTYYKSFEVTERSLIRVIDSIREKCPNAEIFWSVFGLDTNIYSLNFRTEYKYRKIRTRKNSVFGQLRAVGTHK